MFVQAMLLGAGTESAARELQGRLGHFPKMRLFTQRLVRAYVSFDKASEQIHSVLYAFSHRHRRKVARLFQRHLTRCACETSGSTASVVRTATAFFKTRTYPVFPQAFSPKTIVSLGLKSMAWPPTSAFTFFKSQSCVRNRPELTSSDEASSLSLGTLIMSPVVSAFSSKNVS